MRKIVRINMTDLTCKEEDIRNEYKYLGARGLTSAIVAFEVRPKCDPFSAENKVIFAPGLLAGTSAPCSGRISIGGKSPLTGTIKEANAGGTAAQLLAQYGISALVIEGKPVSGRLRSRASVMERGTYIVKISEEGVELIRDDQIKKLGNYELVDQLRKKYGPNISCITIGPAGENGMLSATIAVTDPQGRPTRHAGRGGLGAVLGAKRVKGIVIESKNVKKVTLKESKRFMESANLLAKLLKEHPVTGKALPTYGSNILANVINAVGAYPTRNFSEGRFEGIKNISGEKQREVILKRGGKIKRTCSDGCPIACSRTYVDRFGKYLTKGPEYETIWAHGANCGIDNMDTIAQIDRLCDDYGMDTIEIGGAIAVVMEAGTLQFGDEKAAIRLAKEAGEATSLLGRIIGNGAKVTGEILNVQRVPVVKGQSLPGYDPRAAKGIGVTYATSTMGADHTAGYATAVNLLKLGGFVNPLRKEGQAKLSKKLQILTTALDSVGMCLFVIFCILDQPEAMQAIIDMVNARFGLTFGLREITELGEKVLKIERQFNLKAGIGHSQDRLPDFFVKEKLPPHNVVFDVSGKELQKVSQLQI